MFEHAKRIVAIDWSGAKAGFRRKIWLAEVTENGLRRLEDGRSREEVRDELLASAQSDPSLIVGFDFAFSFPAWFVREKGCMDGPEFWRQVKRHGESWLGEAPFFSRGRFPRESRDAFRSTDWSLRQSALKRSPETVFKLFGQTQVGKGSLRGMPMLDDLREGGFSIWPFDAPALPMVVEIYPRLFYGDVVKSSAAARLAYLERFALSAPHRTLAASSDDAFDAAVSALEMYGRRDELANLEAVDDETLDLEGQIWF